MFKAEKLLCELQEKNWFLKNLLSYKWLKLNSRIELYCILTLVQFGTS